MGQQYQIRQQMIADPQYQQQWADMEKHSPLALPKLFNDKQQVWGLHMEPLGHYVNGKIIPLTVPPRKAAPSQTVETDSVTIDNLRNWYSTADKLGKSQEYKKRIVEVVNHLKAGGQLSTEAMSAMGKDKQELDSISRLTQIAQRVGAVWGQVGQDGFTYVKGKVYDLSFNAQTKDLAIALNIGEVILAVQSGKVQTNKVTPCVLRAFAQANSELDKAFVKAKAQGVEIHR